MNQGWLNNDTFACWIPAQQIIVKGGEDGADKSGKRWIQGIASTNSKDLQGEIVDQNGIDFSYFLKHGYFNDDHKATKVGEPTEAKLTRDGLWVKGFLYKSPAGVNKTRADEYWELMNQLNASDSNRRVGFSIQGKVLRREGSTIKKCWIQEVAITTQPVNTATWAEICKSLSSQPWDLSKAPDEDDKDEKSKDDTDKALAVAGGSPLVPESLEGKAKDQGMGKSMSYLEACNFIKSQTGFDDEAVVKIANVLFDLYSK